jgi:hypothetical protein
MSSRGIHPHRRRDPPPGSGARSGPRADRPGIANRLTRRESRTTADAAAAASSQFCRGRRRTRWREAAEDGSGDSDPPQLSLGVLNGQAVYCLLSMSSLSRLVVWPALLCVAGCADSHRIAELEKQTKDLQQQLQETRRESIGKAASLNLQGKCADQARKEFKENGWDRESVAGFTNHYNAQFNRCFVLIEITKGAPPSNAKSLLDAYEGKQYGDYFWINSQGKKYWEVQPVVCKATMPSGEERNCQSEEEFYDLIKVYMEQ